MGESGDTRDEIFMRRAIELAVANVEAGRGGPFGCVVVRDGVILAEGTNRVTATHDPTAHAEVVAIRRACEQLGTFQLDGAVVYASAMPCPMCLSAIYWARAARIVHGCSAQDVAAVGFDDAFIYAELERPADQRAIPIAQSLRSEALVALRAWAAADDRIEY